MNTFVAITIPPQATTALREVLEGYNKATLKKIPEQKWHITLAFFGATLFSPKDIARLTLPVRLQYMPTITILSLSKGASKDSLWANVQSSQVLTSLHELFLERGNTSDERPFIPHVNLAKLESSSLLGIPESPVKTTFAVTKVRLMQSNNGVYEELAHIPITP